MNRKNERHGLSDTTEYVAWGCMIDRCHNPKNRRFKDYGGRGVSVCDQWRNSFLTFLADIGVKPNAKMSLDRVDNSGNYEAGNVRWAMPIVQAANRRTNQLLTIEGVTMSVSEWARAKGFNRSVVYGRIKKGWPVELLFAPAFAYKENFLKNRAARIAAKTHCPKGHEYSASNTYIAPKTNSRSCKTCMKASLAAYEKVRPKRLKVAA